MSMPTVWMIDPAGDRRGLIAYKKVVAIPRYTDVGSWRVECVLDESTVRAAAAGWRIIIVDESGIYGGHVNEAEIDFDGRELRLTLSGYDDMMWLAASLAWPTPANVLASQTSAYDVRTGVASTVIRQYIDVNRGPSSPFVTRRISFMTLAADPVLGAAVVGRARFDNLLELVQGLAVTGGIGIRTVPTIGRTFTVETYEPPELAGPARFGLALGNLRKLKWRLTAPEATWVVGGGRGEETARSFVSRTNSSEDTAWTRREAFYDYRSASSTDSGAELGEGTQRTLTEKSSTRFVEVIPVDTARLRFGSGYHLGSEVLVDVYGGISVQAVIREVEITATRGGATAPVRVVQPRVGDFGATATHRQTLQIRDALARVASLETRR
jgi:hypothetical protein